MPATSRSIAEERMLLLRVEVRSLLLSSIKDVQVSVQRGAEGTRGRLPACEGQLTMW